MNKNHAFQVGYFSLYSLSRANSSSIDGEGNLRIRLNGLNPGFMQIVTR